MNGKVWDFIGKTNNEFFIKDFEGEYKNAKREGKEYLGPENELIFKGEYLYNHKLKGKYYNNSKLEFKGEFLCDRKWDGKGYDENGNIIYE